MGIVTETSLLADSARGVSRAKGGGLSFNGMSHVGIQAPFNAG
jgi:hypothetical protein